MAPSHTITAAALLLLVPLAGCGNSEAPAPTPSQVPVPGTGAATLTDSSGEQEFSLQNCAATPADGLIAAGTNDLRAVTVNVVGGSGTVTVANLSDVQDTVEGIVETIEVGAQGQFQITATYPDATGQATFTFAGRCTPVGGS